MFSGSEQRYLGSYRGCELQNPTPEQCFLEVSVLRKPGRMLQRVKAFLPNSKSRDEEIRRFTVPADVSSSYEYLCRKISDIFPTLRHGRFTLYWKDSVGDPITISSDEELLEALEYVEDSLFKIYIRDLEPKDSHEGGGEDESSLVKEYSPDFIGVKKEIKQNPESDDDLPLAQQVHQDKQEAAIKRPAKDEDDDDDEEEEEEEEEEDEGNRCEEENGDGVKWTFLEHKGPVFSPPYEPLPDHVNFYYDEKKMKLSQASEEVATLYAKMLGTTYKADDVFKENFFNDWIEMMTPEEKSTITDLKKCNFKEMYNYYKEKKKIKAQNEGIQKKHDFCMMDGQKVQIYNFKIVSPKLFQGRKKNPRRGKIQKRINPEDVTINCESDSKIPQPPAGHEWKNVLHDNKVAWLAQWTDNVQGTKYMHVKLNASSKLKGEKDWQKYVTARKLHRTVDKIRAQYREDWKSKEMRIQQRAVALYFIDTLALGVDNEKEEGETADTVGCCSLRVKHIKLHDKLDEKENVVEFDILYNDSIQYYKTLSVDEQVYKRLKLFMEKKQQEDVLFDCLNTSIMNEQLNSLMEGLTAKVFCTYNASKTLQEQLNLLTNPDDLEPAKLQSYKNAYIKALANQQSMPKSLSKQMASLQIKDEKKIALGTFKFNHFDPRISVAWCKKWNVPIEKIYNEKQQEKLSWAIDLTEPDFRY
ncbi:hypothetical protein ACJMK2_010687 [Sinanodonta woodiana]|uniref:DNA topoisomerase 1 n=1 Tax=Sinanodonta woodiana TaxID=1069815 RepID=A0ABD3VJ48_SINWO